MGCFRRHKAFYVGDNRTVRFTAGATSRGADVHRSSACVSIVPISRHYKIATSFTEAADHEHVLSTFNRFRNRQGEHDCGPDANENVAGLYRPGRKRSAQFHTSRPSGNSTAARSILRTPSTQWLPDGTVHLSPLVQNPRSSQSAGPLDKCASERAHAALPERCYFCRRSGEILKRTVRSRRSPGQGHSIPSKMRAVAARLPHALRYDRRSDPGKVKVRGQQTSMICRSRVATRPQS